MAEAAAYASPLCARWIELDRPYRADPPPAEAVRLARYGGRRLVVTAPHAVRHRRRGLDKPADLRTGGLAELLAERLGGTALGSVGRLGSDPNWDAPPTAFRTRLLEVLAAMRAPALVLDLHGMGDAWGADAVIGLGPAPSRRALAAGLDLRDGLAAAGLATAVGAPFAATHPGTVTACAQGAGADAIQLELAARRRRPLRDPAGSEPVLEALLAWAGRQAARS